MITKTDGYYQQGTIPQLSTSENSINERYTLLLNALLKTHPDAHGHLHTNIPTVRPTVPHSTALRSLTAQSAIVQKDR